MTPLRDLARHVPPALRRRWDAAPPAFRATAPYALVLMAGLFIGATLLGGSGDGPASRWDGIDPVAGHEDGPGEHTEWTCSMHPHVRQPGPGSCPICGMDLIPAASGDEDGEHGDLPRLTVSDRAAALMSVQVWPVERMEVAGEVRLSGTIGYDETLFNDVVVRAEGQVERLHVNFENAAVSRGQSLAEIYSPAVQAASLELLQARRAAQAGGMADLVDAAAAQLVSLGVSPVQVDRILESGEPIRTFTLHSPADGIVSELAARQGEWLMPGGRLLRVAGLGRVWAQLDAYERDLSRIRVGSPLDFAVEALPGEVFRGTVAFIDPVVDGGRRTARVRVQVPNPGGRLKPGMLIRGLGTGAPSADASLVVPASAPLFTGRRSLVYVQVPGTDRPTFEARQVTLGERKGAWWEVGDGLAEGELVVVNGAFRIDSELQIRGRPSMMGATPVQVRPDTTPGPGAGAAAVRLSDAAGRELALVVQAYLDMTLALSRDDAPGAQSAARALHTALQTATMGEVTGGAAATWRRARDDMSARAAAMAGTSDITVLRRELLPLSTRLEESVRTLPSEHVGPLFRAVCPMVAGGQGSWLTREPAVENPYWGAAMFTCGEVQGKVAG